MTADQRKNLEVLEWWKNFNHQPVLQAIARDLLTPPASTVASESYFSASAQVLNDRRHNLSETILEMYVLIKDWIDADRRNQGQETDNKDIEEVEENES
jgi:hypothetical protein